MYEKDTSLGARRWHGLWLEEVVGRSKDRLERPVSDKGVLRSIRVCLEESVRSM